MVHTFQIDKSWQERLRIATFDNDSLAVGNYSGKKNPHKNRTVELKERDSEAVFCSGFSEEITRPKACHEHGTSYQCRDQDLLEMFPKPKGLNEMGSNNSG